MVPLRSATTLFGTPALKRLGADDGAGAAGAVHHDGGCLIGRGDAGPQHQLGARYADRARNVHGGVFVEAADIEDSDVGAALDQRGNLIRGKRWRVAAMFHQLAKRLGVGIDVDEQLIAGVAPGGEPARERADVAIAELCERFGRVRHEPVAVVVENDRHILARQSQGRFERNPVVSHVGGKQRMAGRELRLVPDVEQRDLVARQ
jgi:hypothetical protein